MRKMLLSGNLTLARVALIFLCVLSVHLAARAEDAGFSARGMFIGLPTSIFENVSDGLSENDKEEILMRGHSSTWEIADEDQDSIIFASIPETNRIGLRVFHNEQAGGAIAAYGTLDEPVCSLEVWLATPSGHIVPGDTPDEPKIGEFFSRDRQPVKKGRYSVMICLDEAGLFAQLVIWNRNGISVAKTDKQIRYEWTGNAFNKKIISKK